MSSTIEVATSAPTFDELFRPLDPAFMADPYPSLNRLRELYPVVQEGTGRWLLSRYADISGVNRNPQARRIGPNGVTAAIPWFNLEQYPNASAQIRDSLFLRDGDDHARLRTLVGKAFTPRSLERLYALMRPVIARLLDDAEAAGPTVDVTATFAAEFAVRAIQALFDLPESDYAFYRGVADRGVSAINPYLTPEELQKLDRYTATTAAHIEALIVYRRAHPGEDLISQLAIVEEQGDRLTLRELVALTVQIMGGAISTAHDALGLAVLSLARFPDEFRRVVADPTLAKSAFEETLRFDGNGQIIERNLHEDMVFQGVRVPRGAKVASLLGAGNRDPEVFADPDRYDVARFRDPSTPQILTFGHGPHYCLGRPMALIEGQVLIKELARRYAAIELASAPAFRPSLNPRSLARLEVELVPRADG